MKKAVMLLIEQTKTDVSNENIVVVVVVVNVFRWLYVLL